MTQTRSMHKLQQKDVQWFICNQLLTIEYIEQQEERVSSIYDMFQFIFTHMDIISKYDDEQWMKFKNIILYKLKYLSDNLKLLIKDQNREATEKENQLLELLANPDFKNLIL